MEGQKPPLLFERRSAKRFRAALRVELWTYGQKRTQVPKLEVRDFSQRGFYFFSELRRDPGSRFNFSVLFRSPSSGNEVDLVTGRGEIIRCEDIGPTRVDHFGIAAKIEQTTYVLGDDLTGV